MPELLPLQVFAENYTAAWSSQDAASVARFYKQEASLTVNDGPPAVGRAAIQEFVQGFMTAFPDMQVSMDNIVQAGGGVKYHWTLSGRNTGPGGTGKRIRISGFEEWKLAEDGLIAESRGHFNNHDYQRQLEHGVKEAR